MTREELRKEIIKSAIRNILFNDECRKLNYSDLDDDDQIDDFVDNDLSSDVVCALVDESREIEQRLYIDYESDDGSIWKNKKRFQKIWTTAQRINRV